MKTTLTIADLPAPLRDRVGRICKQEHINEALVHFVREKPGYFGMYEANQWTGWGYYPEENEID